MLLNVLFARCVKQSLETLAIKNAEENYKLTQTEIQWQVNVEERSWVKSWMQWNWDGMEGLRKVMS